MSDTGKPTLLVIDGHSLAFRAFYALPIDSFQTRDGQHTNAIHGFLSMLLSLLQKEKPTHLAVAFDISRFSFRTREYAEYKGTRGETPPEFIGQVPLLQEALAAMNIPTITKEDYEADDILATFAKRGRDEGYEVLVVSGDRDTIQLVTEDVTLLYPSVRGVSELKRYTPEAVRERYGIEPAQYPEIAALVGETSDNLPGIDKVGEKTAVKWITQYGTVAELLEHADEIKGVVGEKLREQKENAIRNRRLNRLIDDLEIPVALADLERRDLDEEAVREVFGRLQFRTLLDRVLKLAGIDPASGAAGAAAAPATPAVQTLVDEELAAWLRRATADGAALGLTVELVDGAPVAFGLASATEAVHVNWASGRMDYVALEEWLASTAPKIMSDAKAQVKALLRQGLVLDGVAMDVRIAAGLVKPGPHTPELSALVREHLDVILPTPDPNQLVPSTEAVGPALEAWYLRQVGESLREQMEPGTARVLDEIELPLLPVLARMEVAGVAIDAPALRALSEELADLAADYAEKSYAAIGHEVNLGSPKQLQQVLFEELELPKTRATKTGYSTDAEAIADLAEKSDHPFLGLLLQHRDVTKQRQIIETLVAAVGPDGRAHTTYQQIGASTGRLSSFDPNLQNIPIKTEVGHRIRSAFRAADGFPELITADYSQIEMRIMAHLSGDEGLIEAFNSGEDLHRFVGARVFGVAPEDVTPIMRTKVKAMSYGLAYGLSAFGLSKQLRIESAEAKQLMTDYLVRFGAVRDYLRGVVEQARVDGYTETIFGRRRPFPDLKSSNRVLRDNAERQALNSPIQGSAADILKIAMVRIESDLLAQGLKSRMLLQVHDELVLEVAEGEREAVSGIVVAGMSDAADLRVPLDVQVGIGPNWDAAGH